MLTSHITCSANTGPLMPLLLQLCIFATQLSTAFLPKCFLVCRVPVQEGSKSAVRVPILQTLGQYKAHTGTVALVHNPNTNLKSSAHTTCPDGDHFQVSWTGGHGLSTCGQCGTHEPYNTNPNPILLPLTLKMWLQMPKITDIHIWFSWCGSVPDCQCMVYMDCRHFAFSNGKPWSICFLICTCVGTICRFSNGLQ